MTPDERRKRIEELRRGAYRMPSRRELLAAYEELERVENELNQALTEVRIRGGERDEARTSYCKAADERNRAESECRVLEAANHELVEALRPCLKWLSSGSTAITCPHSRQGSCSRCGVEIANAIDDAHTAITRHGEKEGRE